jgi:hypothetical protein
VWKTGISWNERRTEALGCFCKPCLWRAVVVGCKATEYGLDPQTQKIIYMNKYKCVMLQYLVLLSCSWGCSQPALVEKPIDSTQQQLVLIGAAYQQYTYDKEAPPSKADDLKQQIQDLGGTQRRLDFHARWPTVCDCVEYRSS